MGKLHIDPRGGIAGDMFSSVMVALGADEKIVVDNMEKAAAKLGEANIVSTIANDGANRMYINFRSDKDHLKGHDARHILDQLFTELQIKRQYRDFGKRALDILIDAERTAHSQNHFESDHYHLHPIGVAHSPFENHAPFRPDDQVTGDFFIEIFPKYQEGLFKLESFSHVMVIAYFDRSEGFSLQVKPPWTDQKVGVFASRSPFRPNPLGMDILRIEKIKDNLIYTSATDFLNNTPVIDIKPVTRSLDKVEVANNGWIEGNDHFEHHKLHHHKHGHGHNTNHHHHKNDDAFLHEAQDIIIDIMGAVTGMQLLDLDTEALLTHPVSVGGGKVKFSHGHLTVPAPAAKVILEKYKIPWQFGPIETELCTPTGTAILAALNANKIAEAKPGKASGNARGGKDLDIEPLRGIIV